MRRNLADETMALDALLRKCDTLDEQSRQTPALGVHLLAA
jgi:hypothetical protein